jgi:phosphatidylserine/phosphatidylglycerophosphate/cardiolipin synthase-like enzyme
MNWIWLAIALTTALLLWRVAYDFVPMYPLNDLSRRTVKSRNRDWTVHYVPLGLALLLNLSPYWLAVSFGLIIALLYAAVQAVSCWLPYLQGGSDAQKSRWEQLYGRTHRFLPGIRDHAVPDTSHVITGVLTLLMLLGMIGNLLLGVGGTDKEASPASAPAASDSAKPVTALVETAFTQAGQKPEQLLIRTLQSARSSIDIAINAINHEEIVKAILDARIRGIQIRILTDRTESTNAAQADKLKSLLEGGIPIKENSRKGLMDLKMSIIDEQAATTGSFNYTVNAATTNDEMLVVVRDTAAVKLWKQQFEAMWNDTENFRELKLGVVPKK